MLGECPALLSAVEHVQALISTERLDVALVTDMAPFMRRYRGDGEKGLWLVDEDHIAEHEVGRAWNALQEEARACQRPLVKSQTSQVAGVDVDIVEAVTNSGEVYVLVLGGSDVVEAGERGWPEVEGDGVYGFYGPGGRERCCRRATHEATGGHGPWGAKRGGLAGG